MRTDIFTIAGPTADDLNAMVAALPGATAAVSKHRPDKHHWAFPNSGRVRVFSTADRSPAGVTLNSDLDDAEHNAWAIEVFEALCRTGGDIALFDEDDNVVRSRASIT